MVSAASLAKGIRLDSVRLRFHAGDDVRWKDPNFDDSSWHIVRNDTAGRVLPSGIGWFRVYLRVMPDAASTIASVWTEPLYAAQETYLDGKPVYAAGVPSAQAEQERVAYYGDTRISFPRLPLPLTSATVHLLAFRLSTWERATARMWFAWRPMTTIWFDEGVTLYIYEQSYIIEQQHILRRRAITQGISTGVLTLILLFVGYLTFSDTSDKLSRYIAYFTICSLLVNAGHTTRYYFSPHVTPYWDDIIDILNTIGSIGKPLSLLLVVVAFFGSSVRRWHIAAFGILCLIPALLQNYWIFLDARSYFSLLMYATLIVFTAVNMSRSRYDINAWVMTLAVIIANGMSAIESVGWLIKESLLSAGMLLGVYTTIPSAFAFVLVRRTAQDRKRLAKYNQDLERQVAERTHNLQTAHEEISRQMEVQAEQSQQIQLKNTELQENLETLRRTQTQLAQAEKMASLGTLVAGVAHELNTPIGVAVTAASTLHGKVQTFENEYKAGGLKKSTLESFVENAKIGADLTLRNLERAANLIQSFKQVAVDQTSDTKRRFKLRHYLEGVITSLEPKWKTTRHRVEIVCEEALEMETYPGAIAQIITNLIDNSLLHGFQGYTEEGIMRIEVEHQVPSNQALSNQVPNNQAPSNQVTITYSDNGRGIPSEVLPRIFDPFFTTKQANGGTGLGMHIVFNLVTQKLGGEIRCESSEKQSGATFFLTFPVQGL
jgi:signal transduction histidine kinase